MISKEKEDKELMIITLLVLMKKMLKFKLSLMDVTIYRLVFKLQEETGYNDFSRTDFGPFSERLYADIKYLLKEKYLRVRKYKNGASDIVLLKKSHNFLKQHQNKKKIERLESDFDDFLTRLRANAKNATQFYMFVMSFDWPIIITIA